MKLRQWSFLSILLFLTDFWNHVEEKNIFAIGSGNKTKGFIFLPSYRQRCVLRYFPNSSQRDRKKSETLCRLPFRMDALRWLLPKKYSWRKGSNALIRKTEIPFLLKLCTSFSEEGKDIQATSK